ncbi:nucleotidyltransferase family protein [Aureimonas populi]|uniref:Nucleotidyltransferase family protein n=1 Tax=Aureimonas populi TaxID=1701758 RepID=A0ABW5CSI3_9HYPH|nr:nucleotidyltransferase family protein [Aureimonas populi]
MGDTASRNARPYRTAAADLCTLLWNDASARIAQVPPASSPLHDPQAARRVLALAVRSKLGDVLAAILSRASHGEIAADARAWAIERKRRTMICNSAALRGIEWADGPLRSRGIAYAVMKGPIQQHMLHGDYFTRPSGDIDLLVAAGDFAAAQDVLMDAGFARVPPAPSLWWDRFLGERHFVREGEVRMVFDLHHRLQQPGSPQPRSSRAFLDRAEAHSLSGRRIAAISAGDVPLLCAMSLVKALFNREPAGNHAFDLMAALRSGREGAADRFLERAKEEDLEGTARLALTLVASLFPDLATPRTGALPEISPETLRAMVLDPDSVADWPRRRRVLSEACLRSPWRTAREFAWLGASEATRWMEERRNGTGRLSPAPEGSAG